MRTSDVIANEMHTLSWELMLQEHQQATHPHMLTIDSMDRHLDEIEKNTKEMRRAVADMRKVQAVKDMEKVEAQA